MINSKRTSVKKVNNEKGKYLFRDIGEIDKVAEENEMNQCNLLLVK